MEGRALQADALEQLGYQAWESGPEVLLPDWRSCARVRRRLEVRSAEKSDAMAAMTVEMLLQFVGVHPTAPPLTRLAFTSR